MEHEICVRPFQPGDEALFRDINLDWIGRYFVVEEKDRQSLDDPRGAILDKGGAILMACDALGAALGCIALIPMEGDTVELAKMGVRPQAQGRGVGRRLIQESLACARRMGAHRVYLETNSQLKPALWLYAEAGFVRVEGPPSPYARADVQMELLLD